MAPAEMTAKERMLQALENQPGERGDSLATEPGAEVDAPSPVDDAEADPTLIEWMLDRSPEQRLEALQGFVDSVWELLEPPRTGSGGSAGKISPPWISRRRAG